MTERLLRLFGLLYGCGRTMIVIYGHCKTLFIRMTLDPSGLPSDKLGILPSKLNKLNDVQGPEAIDKV